ncbi:general substrate transporter [Trichoderma barbatum]
MLKTHLHHPYVFSVYPVGIFIGGLATMPLTNPFSRTRMLVAPYMLSLLGAFLQVFVLNLAALVNIVPTSIRGQSVQIYNIISIFSGVIATIISLSIEAGVPAWLFILTLGVSEPQWLVSRGRTEGAKKSLRRPRGFPDFQLEIEFRIIVLCEGNERELVSNVILLTTYTTGFHSQFGVGNACILTIIASLCNLAGAVVASMVLDLYGRHLTVLWVGTKTSALGIVFNFVWALSFFCVSVLLLPEILTSKLQSHTMAYTVACCQTTAVITTFAVPQLTSADAANLGPRTYLVFAGGMACIVFWSYLLTPETKDRTCSDIDEIYNKKVSMRKRSEYKTDAKQSDLIAERDLRKWVM